MESQQNHEVIVGDVGGIDGSNGGGGGVQSTSNSTDGSQMSQMYSFVSEAMSPSTISMSTSVSSVVNRGRSKVWNEFQVTQDGKKVTCRQCGDSLSYSHSHSTSSMLKHLKRKHNMDLYPHVGDEESSKQNSQVKSLDKASKKSVKAKKIPQVVETPQQIQEEEYVPQPEPSIQHDPLLFADACVRMRWADHSDTFLKTFSVMYNDESYTDCTIVAEKQFFKGHRVILSSASELFDEMFKTTQPGQHPLIFLKDVKAMELRILLDFIYKGEVAIPPSLIPGLVKVGGDLKVKGLSDFVWNEQLASTIFQGYQTMDNRQQPQQQQQQPQQVLQPQTSVMQNSLIQSYASTIPNTSTTTVAGKLLSPLRTTTNMTQATTTGQSTSTYTYVPDKPCTSTATPTSSGGTRTYARVLSNVRAVNVLPSQSMGVNLGDGSTLLNQGSSGFKRIRLISASSLPTTTKGCGMPGVSRFDGTLSDIGMDCDTSSETVLMVTNQGETVLSTSQGGVTVMTPNTLSLPMGVTVKEERCMDTHDTHQLQPDHMNSHPITILSSSGGTNNQEDMQEVVYSITEVSDGGHEVLMTSAGETMDPQSIVVYGTHQPMSISDSQDKKPFHLSLHKP